MTVRRITPAPLPWTVSEWTSPRIAGYRIRAVEQTRGVDAHFEVFRRIERLGTATTLEEAKAIAQRDFVERISLKD
jgi:hypothetical protein